MALYPGMNRANTAVMVIDPVNSCAHENCETPEWNIHFSKIRKMLPKLRDFISQYRGKVGGPIIFTKITPWNKEHLPDNMNELYTDPQAYYYSEDTTGFDEQFHTVFPVETDKIFEKNTYDAFTNEELIEYLKARGIRYIVMTGIFTDGCVLASIVSGFAKGFNFVILSDLVETTDDEDRQAIQRLLIKSTFPRMYGKTLDSQSFLEDFK